MHEQRLFICKSCGRDMLDRPHARNCPEADREERERQTNLKCREFGMPDYYQEARPFPRQGP